VVFGLQLSLKDQVWRHGWELRKVFVYDAIIQYPNIKRREAATQPQHVKIKVAL